MIKIVFLGTTSGIPTKERNLPSIFMMYKDERMLFDCGEGTQRQLMIKNLKFMKIDRIFITHWHADHFAGLLGLIQTMSLEGRTRPLYVYGPARTNEFVNQLLTIGYFARNFDVVAEDLDEESVVDCEGYKIIPFRVEHRVPSLGYVFQEDKKLNANMEKAAKFGLTTSPLIGDLKAGKTITFNGKKITPDDIIEKVPGRKVVYSGDTRAIENTIKYAQGADILIHDSTFCSDFHETAHDFMHSTSEGAAEIAKKARVKKLYLTHISRRYQEKESNVSPRKLEKDAKRIFKNSFLAEDFLEVQVK